MRRHQSLLRRPLAKIEESPDRISGKTGQGCWTLFLDQRQIHSLELRHDGELEGVEVAEQAVADGDGDRRRARESGVRNQRDRSRAAAPRAYARRSR